MRKIKTTGKKTARQKKSDAKMSWSITAFYTVLIEKKCISIKKKDQGIPIFSRKRPTMIQMSCILLEQK